MRTPTDPWENLLLLAGSPDRVPVRLGCHLLGRVVEAATIRATRLNMLGRRPIELGARTK